MERTRLVIGNWKMELSYGGQLELARSIKQLLPSVSKNVDIVICPSYPVLAAVREVLHGGVLALGAQHVHWEERGAWTGEVSVSQLASLVAWCIVGHSEQRHLTGMTDEQVCATAHLLLQQGITPVVCVGETREEHDTEVTIGKVTAQVAALLRTTTRTSLSKLVIAYEPIWAIGSGEMPDPEEAASVMLLIRKLVAEQFDNEVAERVRVIYGGSVSARTAASYVTEPGVDGVLVGGASLKPRDFIEIVRLVATGTS